MRRTLKLKGENDPGDLVQETGVTYTCPAIVRHASLYCTSVDL